VAGYFKLEINILILLVMSPSRMEGKSKAVYKRIFTEGSSKAASTN
jgi:hypothetical protein